MPQYRLPKKALKGAYRSLQPTDKYTVYKLLFYKVKIKLKLISKKLVLSDQIAIMVIPDQGEARIAR